MLLTWDLTGWTTNKSNSQVAPKTSITDDDGPDRRSGRLSLPPAASIVAQQQLRPQQLLLPPIIWDIGERRDWWGGGLGVSFGEHGAGGGLDGWLRCWFQLTDHWSTHYFPVLPPKWVNGAAALVGGKIFSFPTIHPVYGIILSWFSCSPWASLNDGAGGYGQKFCNYAPYNNLNELFFQQSISWLCTNTQWWKRSMIILNFGF